MKRKELDIIIVNHGKWLDDEDGGERANLQYANLQRADLHGARLQYANLQGANLQGANLQRANLHRANLYGANLQGANLDYSAFPLWCGGTCFKADDKLVAQVLAHLCSLDVSDAARSELDKVLAFARTSHRAKECGILEKEGEE